jgi:hypothetical protein
LEAARLKTDCARAESQKVRTNLGRLPGRRTALAAAALLVSIITAYLLMERSHAEEVGGGSRVGVEILRGERPVSAMTWLAFGVTALVLVAAGRTRVQAPARAARGR